MRSVVALAAVGIGPAAALAVITMVGRIAGTGSFTSGTDPEPSTVLLLMPAQGRHQLRLPRRKRLLLRRARKLVDTVQVERRPPSFYTVK